MTFYQLRKDILYQQDAGDYTSYGIDVFNSQSNVLIRSIPDISLEKGLLKNLISLCNDLQLDIIHLDDVVDDFLSWL